ncbi:hypothetical protein [Streptomyces fulvoviolaceus]|uniref:hypothetical protein n=1 Tax=Streptomyces fulvoviolaceus TaxID=285535 RepID=UPI001F2732DA|nr:hypothetical protein [Streptomyces fulvoviolaceus]MCT9077873.1 hypothetical protein [Streptomyces fulvoviolaceus]
MTTVGGVAAALVGVLAGSLLTSRAERMHWSRDKQIEACAAIVAESTRIQLALRRAWCEGESVDWVPWNVALGTIWLVGSPAVVAAAATMDEVFWDHSDQFVQQTATGEEVWRVARDRMEGARLNFINAARLHVDPRHTRLAQVPVSRPPLPHGTGSGTGRRPDGHPAPGTSSA